MSKLFSSCVLLLTCVSMGFSNPLLQDLQAILSTPLITNLPNISLSSIPGLENINGTISVGFLNYLQDPEEITVTNIVYTATGFVTLTFGTKSDTVGTVSLPVNLLCNPPVQNGGPVARFVGQLIQYLICNICANDCFAAHNKYSGACRNVDDPFNTNLEGSMTCYCADTPEIAQRMGLTATTALNNTAGRCKTLLPSLLQLLIPEDSINALFFGGVRARYIAVLCGAPGAVDATTTTCTQDCLTNHKYVNNVTQQCTDESVNVPIPYYNGFSNAKETYCECGNYTSYPSSSS